jgi:transposase
MERIDISTEEVSQLLKRAKPVLGPEDFALLEKIVQSFLHVSELLEEKGVTIGRLKRLLFGSKSEKLTKIFPEATEKKDVGAAEEGAVSGASGAEASEGADDGKRDDRPKEEEEKKKKEKAKGHGRNGAEDYTGAEQIHIPHPSLKPGDPCQQPGCKGKVYQFEPLVMVRVVGQAPLGAKVHTVAQLRCNLCLKVFSACSPEEFGTEKYDESAASMIAILTYGTGVPFYRLEGLQGNLGIPLPASTQWDVVHRAAKLVAPAFEELIRQAAQGDVLHNDDTTMKILEYMERKERREDGG